MSSKTTPPDRSKASPKTRATQDVTEAEEPVEGRGHLDQAKGRVKDALQEARDGFDNLSDQKIGARIGDNSE